MCTSSTGTCWPLGNSGQLCVLCDLGTGTGVTGVEHFCCGSQRRRTLKSGGRVEITASSAVNEGQMQLNVNITVMQLWPGPKMYALAQTLLHM